MLRVTVGLVPWGVPPARRLAEIEIANDGTGSTDVGNYDYRITTFDDRGHPHRGAWYRLRGHRRRDGALALLAAILVQHRRGPREHTTGAVADASPRNSDLCATPSGALRRARQPGHGAANRATSRRAPGAVSERRA